MKLLTEISPGELLDKISILEIKRSRIQNAAQLRNINRELSLLEETRAQNIPYSKRLNLLYIEIKAVNERLWKIEDDIRQCERAQDFGEKFVALARSVYHNNDQRSAIKRKINELLGSQILEEKSYAPY